MTGKILSTALLALTITLPAAAQNYAKTEATALETAAPAENWGLAGQWTYRSFLNNTGLVSGDKDKALALIFGEGIFTFAPPIGKTVTGTLDLGGGYVLDLKGRVTATAPLSVAISGYGRAGTPTEGWEYDYNGILAYRWPNGVNQVPALVGSVIRAKPHNGSPAGLVASFVAVKHP